MPCSIAISSSSKSGGQHASPIRSIIDPLTVLTLLLLCNSKQQASENISQFFSALNYIIVTSSSCLKQPYRWMKKKIKTVRNTWRWSGFNKNVNWHSWIWKTMYEQIINGHTEFSLNPFFFTSCSAVAFSR